MFNKIYDKLKKFLKENLLAIGVLVFVYAVCNIQLPYYIDAPGTIINVADRISIENSFSSNGSLSMASVTEIKGIIPTLLWAFIDKDMDIVKKEEKVYNNETYEEASIRSHLLLNDSKNSAVIVAFEKANKSYKISNPKLHVIYIDEQAKTSLKIGDEIIRVNGQEVKDVSSIKKIVNDYAVGDFITVDIRRNNEEISTTAKIFTNKEEKYMGISALTSYEIKTEPQVKFSFKQSESGPSGGLMLSLAIYNSLIEEDITRGRNIVGTGTIDINGNVGAIGGVKYKIAAAVKANADLFIVPKDNYKEAKEVVKKNNYNIKLLEVSTFDEALEKLSNI